MFSGWSKCILSEMVKSQNKNLYTRKAKFFIFQYYQVVYCLGQEKTVYTIRLTITTALYYRKFIKQHLQGLLEKHKVGANCTFGFFMYVVLILFSILLTENVLSSLLKLKQ